jgi:Uncharacterized protein conserved in bacteria (DUF2314)
MLDFLRRDRPSHAAVSFSEAAPPPVAAFGRLRAGGYALTERRQDDALWALRLEHPVHGQADLWCERDAPLVDDYIRFASNLSDAEKAAAVGSRASVRLEVPARRKQVLRDRKTMLRIARDVLGDDGLLVLDVGSELPWSRASLDDELQHDADLDIEALYCLHAVIDDPVGSDQPATGGATNWLHTHGLAELGRFDVDIVAPHPAFVAACADPIRAIAMMVLDGAIAPDEARFAVGQPGGDARLVPARGFMRDADPSWAALRGAGDHADHRSVISEPVGRRLLGFGRGDRPEPWRFAQRPPAEQFVIFFSTSATDLMAERAQATVGVLRALMAEFAEFEVVAIVKLGYPTPDGGKEHLWFTAHRFGDTTVDATLENQPFLVDLRAGERADRPIAALTDWLLLTPAGQVTPRSMIAARRLREHADEIRTSMAEGRSPAPGLEPS